MLPPWQQAAWQPQRAMVSIAAVTWWPSAADSRTQAIHTLCVLPGEPPRPPRSAVWAAPAC